MGNNNILLSVTRTKSHSVVANTELGCSSARKSIEKMGPKFHPAVKFVECLLLPPLAPLPSLFQVGRGHFSG